MINGNIFIMTGKTERTRNFNDTAEVSEAIVLNSVTRTTVVSANSDRMSLQIQNLGNKKVRIFQQEATTLTGEGERLVKNAIWYLLADNPYLGEVSAIAESGNSEVVFQEY